MFIGIPKLQFLQGEAHGTVVFRKNILLTPFSSNRRSLAYFQRNGEDKTWEVAKGLYKILVGSSSQDIKLQ